MDAEEARLPVGRALPWRCRCRIHLAATAFALLASCAIVAPRDTFWATRRVVSQGSGYIEVRSHLASHGTPAVSRLQSIPLIEKTAAGIRLELRRDAASKQDWGTSRQATLNEIGSALVWLRESHALWDQTTDLTLVAVDPGSALDITDHKPATDSLALTIYAPLDTSSPSRLSTTLRSGFATAFHELIHARNLETAKIRKRVDEEYLATMFESCYLIDSVRTGDRLHLNRASQHSSNYALVSSTKGANEAISRLQDIAGPNVIDASSTEPLQRLRDFCHRFIETKWAHPTEK